MLNKVVVITDESYGFGRASALLAAEEGASVGRSRCSAPRAHAERPRRVSLSFGLAAQ
jgi:NAD(P)-dependent dehydrogenase (short-subunit alcohol dehydrogenase family)